MWNYLRLFLISQNVFINIKSWLSLSVARMYERWLVGCARVSHGLVYFRHLVVSVLHTGTNVKGLNKPNPILLFMGRFVLVSLPSSSLHGFSELHISCYKFVCQLVQSVKKIRVTGLLDYSLHFSFDESVR